MDQISICQSVAAHEVLQCECWVRIEVIASKMSLASLGCYEPLWSLCIFGRANLMDRLKTAEELSRAELALLFGAIQFYLVLHGHWKKNR